MYNFNVITEANEKEVVAKFKEYGVGVAMGNYTKSFDNSGTAKWAELVDESIYSMNAIKNKMLEIARTINTSCNDELLGDLTVAFTIRDHKNKLIKFTWLDIYTFLRAVYKFRKETVEYKKQIAEVKSLKAFVEANKSTEDKLKEAQEKLAKLAASGVEFDEE
jgi:hypothetical protein